MSEGASARRFFHSYAPENAEFGKKRRKCQLSDDSQYENFRILYLGIMYKVKIAKSEFSIVPEDGGFSVDGKVLTPDIIEIRKGKFHILNNNRSYTAEVVAFDKETKTFTIRVNHNQYVVDVKDRFDDLLFKLGIDAGAGKKVNDVKAPMPGMVLNVMVENGQSIKKGDALVVLEAMKMENILKSPADGIVKKIRVTKGDKVEKNQVMVNFE